MSDLESGSCRSGREEPVGERIGISAGTASGRDLVRQPAKILDENDAQRDRYGPQLADRQRLDALIGSNEATQNVWIKVAVGVGDKRPSETEDPRIARERPLDELRQLPIVAGRHVIPNLANLLFDKVVIVEQPFRGGNHGPTALQLRGGCPIG